MDVLKHYIDQFNSNDEELYPNLVDNSHSYEWLRREIPLWECPDADLERTYYFRWWTLRKHLKMTEDGYLFSEFLPPVDWSGKHNSIVAAIGHHLYEGRWLKNGARYLEDYVRFFFTHPEKAHDYSSWFADGVLKLTEVSGDLAFAREVLPSLCRHYRVWEETQQLPNGMFWSQDGHDAMECSISGTTPGGEMWKGIRPTLNSYLCADALAISRLAALLGESKTAEEYLEKHQRLRALINENLWEDGFYRAYHAPNEEALPEALAAKNGTAPRELLGYIPFMFDIPQEVSEQTFELLQDPNSFHTPFGPATAEQSHPRFLYPVGHECLWNGYVWPFATAQTLYAVLHAAERTNSERLRQLYCEMLLTYARSHVRTREDGVIVPWIDEVRHPLRDEWSCRRILKDWGWKPECGGYERGKDYNHSTFCDLVITGIAGVRPSLDGTITVKPNIPAAWNWFRLSGVHCHGKCYRVTFDRDGSHYGGKSGLTVEEM